MVNIANISFFVVGLACILFGCMFMVRRKARVFYGVQVEGRGAIVSGGILIVTGIAVIVFGMFVFPDLFDLEGVLQELPEFRDP